jgi:hypothetical protein
MRQLQATMVGRAPRLAVRSVRYPTTPLGTYEKLEVAFQVDATYDNPFDPAQIAVQAVFRLPDGTEASVPGFFDVPYASENGVTQMEAYANYRPAGEPGWRARYAPPVAGKYSFRIQVRDRRGQCVQAGPFAFAAVRTGRSGYVRVARGSPRYFENSADGSLFFGTGANVAWTRSGDPGRPVGCYEYYYSRAAGKTNATRVFLCHWAWLEWTPQVADRPASAWPGYGGAGWYNQMIASSLDQVFALAERHHLRVMLVTDTGDEWFPTPDAWGSHPYSVAYGGPCARPEEMFTAPEARRLYRNRLRYILARWGYSDSLWALDAWNNCQNPGPAELRWIREMRDQVHDLCRGWRPIIHGTNYRFAANQLSDYAQAERQLATDRPNVVQECYYTEDAAWFRPVLRRQLWEGLTQGLAAVMVWHHVLVEQTNAWRDFRPVMKTAAALPLHRGSWRPVQLTVTRADGVPPRAPYLFEARAYGDVPEWGVRAPRNRFALDLSQRAQWLEGFGPTLYGDRPDRAGWRNPPTLVVDLPGPGRVLVETEEIGGGDQTLAISVDGAVAGQRTYTGGRRYIPEQDAWTEAPLAAGHHEIVVDNAQSGGDWLRLRRLVLALEGDRPEALVSAQGLTDGREGVVYLSNRSHDQLWETVTRQAPLTLRQVTLRLAGLEEGECQVCWVDPATGTRSPQATVACRDGAFEVSRPELGAEAALLFRRR